MTDIWPDSLAELIAKQECVLFLGAGFTMQATQPVEGGKKPVTWPRLLENLLADAFPSKPESGLEVKSRIGSQIENGDLLNAAQALESLYMTRGHGNEFRRKIAIMTNGADEAPLIPGRAHELLGELLPRILITTNYDSVLERHFGAGFPVYSYDSTSFADRIRSGREMLMKLHGTHESVQDLVLTRLDFTRLRRKGDHVLSVVEALILTRTVVFLGYSLDDPDIQLILENQFGKRSVSAGHYLLTHEPNADSDTRRIYREAYGVEILTYSGDRSEGFVGALEELVASVQQIREGWV